MARGHGKGGAPRRARQHQRNGTGEAQRRMSARDKAAQLDWQRPLNDEREPELPLHRHLFEDERA